MSAADQLAALPEPVQLQFLRIYREAAGMSDAEKLAARLMLGSTIAAFALGGSDDSQPAVHMVSACGLIVKQLDDLAAGVGV